MPEWRAALARILRVLPMVAVLVLIAYLLMPYLVGFKNFLAATDIPSNLFPKRRI